jgi:hypothetical protein
VQSAPILFVGLVRYLEVPIFNIIQEDRHFR